MELGIAPNELLDAEEGVLEAMFAYIHEKNKNRE